MYEIEIYWDWGLVLLSYIMATCGSYTAVQLAEQRRIAIIANDTKKEKRYLIFTAMALGGSGIWSMHFIGMGAVGVRVNLPTGSHEVNINFDMLLTTVSLLFAVVFVWLGLSIAAKDKYFKSQNTSNVLLGELQHLSISELASSNARHKMKKHALFSGLHHIVIGGLVSGSGVAAMHYTGVAAQRMKLSTTWNYGIMSLSCIIGCVASAAAFFIVFRLLVFRNREIFRFVSAMIMGVAVCGMHYTASMAGTFTYDESQNNTGFNKMKATRVAIVGGFFLCFSLGMIMVTDQRVIIRNKKISRREHSSGLYVSAGSPRGVPTKGERSGRERSMSGNIRLSHSSSRRDALVHVDSPTSRGRTMSGGTSQVVLKTVKVQSSRDQRIPGGSNPDHLMDGSKIPGTSTNVRDVRSPVANTDG